MSLWSLPLLVLSADCRWSADHGLVVCPKALAANAASRGARIRYLELCASEVVRLDRNGGASRLAEKPSKRDLESSRRNLLETGAKYRLNSAGEFDGRDDYLRIDNTELSPDEVARRAIAAFGFPVTADR